MRKEELAGRAGKQPDGSSKTRLAYLGCVFTQHKTDEQGHPVIILGMVCLVLVLGETRAGEGVIKAILGILGKAV